MRRQNPIFLLGAAIALAGLSTLPDVGPSFAVAEERKATVAGPTGPKFTTLTSTQLAVMLRNKDFYFVNVHVPYEGEINKTDAFVAFDRIAQNLDRLPKDKSDKIVLYCQSGRMSGIAARELARLGYSNVSHLAGGMIDWNKRGYQLLSR